MTETIEQQPHPSARSKAGIAALLAAVGLLVLGNGLQGTLLALRAETEGMGELAVGLFMSAYFFGYAAGAELCPNLVTRVGHIRAFAGFASIASGIALLHAIVIDPWAWVGLRMIHGVCYAGLILVTESWLNEATDASRRGRLLGLYVNVVLVGWGASQPLLYIAPVESFVLFALVSILLSFSLVPVTFSTVGQTGRIDARRMKVRSLMRISPMGTVGTFVVGVQISAFWALGPVATARLGLTESEIAMFFGINMLGAVLLQMPIGRLSDRIDRRLVMLACAAASGLVCLPFAIAPDQGLYRLLGFAMIYGGLLIPVYSMCVAHVNDHAPAGTLASVASGLILVYGAGATLGPLAAAGAVDLRGPGGLFEFVALVQALFVAFSLWRLRRASPVPARLKQRFVALPRTTPIALGLTDEDRDARRRRREGRRALKAKRRAERDRRRAAERAALRGDGTPPPTAGRRRG